MLACVHICDCCGLVEQFGTGSFYTFRYKVTCADDLFAERKKMVICHSCFTKMIDYCSGINTSNVDWQDTQEEGE